MAPSPGQVEAVETTLSLRPGHFNQVHPRHPRTRFSSQFQLFQVVSFALGHELDSPIVPIAHPATQAQAIGLPHQEVTETDALDVAADRAVQTLHSLEVICCSQMPTSTIVAIGDELVGGFTLDTNSHWLAERLRLLGFPVKRITGIRDRPHEIVEQLRRELADDEVTHVFCSGGLGPTPDDRTFASLADALDRKLIVWEETRARIERRVQRMHEAGLLESPELTEGNLRMARIPTDPIQVFKNRRGMAPGVVYESSGKRIFVLPGVPLEMKSIFTEELEPQFLAEGSATTVRELRFTFAVEARFFPLMTELEHTFPDVSVGSYPNFETKELVIRCLGLDPKRVDEVIELVRRRSAQLGMVGTG